MWAGCTAKPSKGNPRTLPYGQLLVGRKAVPAHRISWEIHNGPIPDGMCVLHICDNPKCVNPEHLFVGTRADNANDCYTKGRMRWKNAELTHCKRGHPFTTENTYHRPDAPHRRECRICRAQRARDARHRV